MVRDLLLPRAIRLMIGVFGRARRHHPRLLSDDVDEIDILPLLEAQHGPGALCINPRPIPESR